MFEADAEVLQWFLGGQGWAVVLCCIPYIPVSLVLHHLGNLSLKLPEAASCPLSKRVGLPHCVMRCQVSAVSCLGHCLPGVKFPENKWDHAHLHRGVAPKRRSMELGVKHSSGWAAGAVGQGCVGTCVGENISGTVSSSPRRRGGKRSQQAWWTFEGTSLKTALKRLVLWHWHLVWSLPMKSDLWHHLGKTLEYLCRRTRVYHSFILGFPQRVTGCINSDMIPVWPGL